MTSPTPATTLSTEPPDVTLPAIPAGFVRIDLTMFRGRHPKAAQITAVPDAVAEIASSTSYAATFGIAAPTADAVERDLSLALRWTVLRRSLEELLVYARTNEAITWKTGLATIDRLEAAFRVVAAQEPTIAALFPATARLVEVPVVQAKRASATRARNAKAKGASTASATATRRTVAASGAPSAASAVAASTPATTVTPGGT